MNLATLLEGPANLKHRNVLVHFDGGLSIKPLAEVFKIRTDINGTLAARALQNSVVISGKPDGEFSDEHVAMMHRWQNAQAGQLLTPRYDVDTVTHGTESMTLIGDKMPRNGCPVKMYPFPGSTMPTGWTAGQEYFWNEAGTLHANEADGIAGTTPVAITDNGTGDFALIEQEYIQIDAVNINRRIVFHNGCVSEMPPIILSAIKTIFGPMSFVAFLKNNAAWSDANSLYTVSKLALTDTPSDKDLILTQEYSCAFGASPWDSFKTRDEITITTKMNTEVVDTDGRGNLGLKFNDMDVTATLTPQGFSPSQMLDLLELQGGTVRRGGDRVRGNLVVTGTGVHATVYNGAARELPQTFQTTGKLAGQIAIDGCVEPGSGYFRIAEAAP